MTYTMSGDLKVDYKFKCIGNNLFIDYDSLAVGQTTSNTNFTTKFGIRCKRYEINKYYIANDNKKPLYLCVECYPEDIGVLDWSMETGKGYYKSAQFSYKQSTSPDSFFHTKNHITPYRSCIKRVF